MEAGAGHETLSSVNVLTNMEIGENRINGARAALADRCRVDAVFSLQTIILTSSRQRD